MITVVITTCKRAPEIVLRAVRSVLRQTYTDYEIIVVDDSPQSYERRSDVQNAIQQLNSARIRYYAQTSSKGACAARNVGIAEAKGDYIAFLDDDDEWLEEKLDKQLEMFKKSNSRLALVYSQFVYHYDDSNSEKIPYDQFKRFQKGMVYDSLIKFNYIGSTSFPLIKRDALIDIGCFDEQMPSCQDYDVWLRLANKYYVDYVEEPLIRFHIHKNESIGKNTEKKIRGQERLFKKNEQYLLTHKDALYERLAVMVPMYAENGEKNMAWTTIRRMICIHPLRVLRNTRMIYAIIKI